ncbi:hypothetical protein HYU17_00575 [Candidatus Woesearchaeota archaeon]|nr:hypothetical protein [Candidatus Woesearchaeota archaeon]
MLKSKRGISLSYKMFMWVPRFIYTIVVVATIFWVISSFIMTRTNVYDAESKILASAAYYSGNGFSKSDPDTGRVYTGVIDSESFSTKRLGDLLVNDKPLIVGRFVKKQAAVDYQLGQQPGQAIYTDKDRYERWQPLAQAGGKGEGSKAVYSDVRYAAVLDPATGRTAGYVVETVFIASG